MEEKKPVLILIDEAVSSEQTAGVISAALGAYQTTILQAASFSGTDLLPAYAFFLGCESPKPPSFEYIEDLFKHINLAGRPCGVFSTDRKALKYLSALIKDSEAVCGKPLLVKTAVADPAEIQKWIQSIVE
jgi:hypothetical protein